MTGKSTWSTAPILGVRNVRQTAEYYRDVLGFELDPETGVFQGAGNEPDVDTLYRELQTRGAANVSPPQNAPYGLREILVEDPNGYRVAFGAPL